MKIRPLFLPLPALIQKLVREKAGCFSYNSSANMNKENKNAKSKNFIERSKNSKPDRSEQAKVRVFSFVAFMTPQVTYCSSFLMDVPACSWNKSI